MNNLSGIFLTVFLQFLSVGVPLAILACSEKSYKPLIAAIFFLLAFGFDSIGSSLISTLNSQSFHENWNSKLFEFLWPFFLVYASRWLSPNEVGLLPPKHKMTLLWSAAIGVLFAIINIAEMISFDDLPSFDHPQMTALFQFTLPGLGEEVVYRGVLLAILNRYLAKQWTVFRMRFGWGVILVSILFILVHILHYSSIQNKISWNLDVINFKILPQIILFSFVLGFIREKTGSVWPCVICHNLMNGLAYSGIWVWANFK